MNVIDPYCSLDPLKYVRRKNNEKVRKINDFPLFCLTQHWECRPRHWECCTLVSDRRGRDISGEGWDRLRETQSTKDMIKKICISLLIPGCMLYAKEICLTLPESKNCEANGLWKSSGTVNSDNTANPGALVDLYKNSDSKVYLGLNGGLDSSNPLEYETANEGNWVYDAVNKTGEVTLCGRTKAKGENFTMVFSPTDFVTNDKISSITLSATGNATFNAEFKQYGLVIAIVDDKGNVKGQQSDTFTSGTIGTKMSTTLNFGNALVWQDGYKVIAGIVGPQGNGTTEYTISDIQVKADVTVPEPATATLSLLALAGMCGRRRRKKA